MSAPPPALCFFAHERNDARVLKRLQAIQDQGWHVIGFTFHREREGKDRPVFWENIHLGTTYDRRYVHRLWAIGCGLLRLVKERHRLAGVRCLYAINFDNALLALFARWLAPGRIPVVVEIADIQPPMVGTGAASRLLRWVERRVLAASQLLVTTSPGFLKHYFTPLQHYTGPVFLLENKVYPSAALSAARPPAPPPPAAGQPWIVGYFGGFRCHRSWELIKRLSRRLDVRVVFYLRGYATVLDATEFSREAAEHTNVEFGGPYTYPGDLPALYGRTHLNWCFDFHDATANSRWLLPNRIYEGGLHHVPGLAAAGTETAAWLEEKGLGWSFPAGEELEEALYQFFLTLSPEVWSARRQEAAQRPDTDFTGEADYAALGNRLAGLAE